MLVEEEGERESFSATLTMRKKFPWREDIPKREREVGKRRKNMEDMRTDLLLFLFDRPRPLVPPRPLLPPRNDQSENKRRLKSRREGKTEMREKRILKLKMENII